MVEPVRYPVSQPLKGAGGPTGTWRTMRPVIDHEKCNGCLFCWMFCPEGVVGKDDRTIDYEFCKGCGVCAVECPKQAIVMVKEEER